MLSKPKIDYVSKVNLFLSNYPLKSNRDLFGLHEYLRMIHRSHFNDQGRINIGPGFIFKFQLTGYQQKSVGPNFRERNWFCINTLSGMGGSHDVLLRSGLGEIRYGGSLADSLLYLSGYNNLNPNCDFRFTARHISRAIGYTKGNLVPLTSDEVISSVKINYLANPGPWYKMIGCVKKADSLRVAVTFYYALLDCLSNNSSVSYPFFGIAGRPKLKSITGHLDKLYDGKCCGRAVWMADMHEQLIGAFLSIPFTNSCSGLHGRIAIGFNKFGLSAKKFKERMGRYNVWICGDFDEFDTRIPSDLIIKSFEVLKYIFGIENDSLYHKLLKYIQRYFIYTDIVLPNGDVYRKRSGIPSGSSLTSIIGSLCNFIALYEGLSELGLRHIVDFDITVCGDDCVIGLKSIMSNVAYRRRYGEDIRNKLSVILKRRFNMLLNVLKTTVCTYLCVGVEFFDGNRSLGVSDTIKECEDAFLLTNVEHIVQFECNDSSLRSFLPLLPCSANLRYHFKDRVKFLSYYFTEGDKMIRPTSEIISRLINPETNNVSLAVYQQSLRAAFIENYSNLNAVKLICMLYADSEWMKIHKISRRKARSLSIIFSNYYLNKDNPRESGIMRDRFKYFRMQSNYSDYVFSCHALKKAYRPMLNLAENMSRIYSIFKDKGIDLFFQLRKNRSLCGIDNLSITFDSGAGVNAVLRRHYSFLQAMYGRKPLQPLVGSRAWDIDDLELFGKIYIALKYECSTNFEVLMGEGFVVRVEDILVY